MSDAPDIPPRTKMQCRMCGCFSSAQTCWTCSTNPVALRVTELERQLAAANQHLDAAYEAAGLSHASSEPLDGAIGRQLTAIRDKCQRLDFVCNVLRLELNIDPAISNDDVKKMTAALQDAFSITNKDWRQLKILASDMAEDLRAMRRGADWSLLCAAPGEPALLAYEKYLAGENTYLATIRKNPPS